MKHGFVRFLSVLMSLVLILSCAAAVAEDWTCPACGNAASGNFCSNCGKRYESVSFDTMLEISKELKEQLVSSTNGTIASLYSSAPEVVNTAEELSNALKSREAAQMTVIFYRNADLESLILTLGEIVPETNFTSYISSQLSSLPATLMQSLNAQQGATWMAASSLLSASKLRVLNEYAGCSAVVIMDFGEDAPADVYVSFTVSDDGAALISAHYVKFTEDAKMILKLLSGGMLPFQAFLSDIDVSEKEAAILAGALGTLQNVVTIRSF